MKVCTPRPTGIGTVEARRSRRHFLRLALAVIGLGAACTAAPAAPTSSGPPKPADQPQPTEPATPVAPVTLAWGSTSGAGDSLLAIAQAKGYFAEQGITLDAQQFAT